MLDLFSWRTHARTLARTHATRKGVHKTNGSINWVYFLFRLNPPPSSKRTATATAVWVYTHGGDVSPRSASSNRPPHYARRAQQAPQHTTAPTTNATEMDVENNDNNICARNVPRTSALVLVVLLRHAYPITKTTSVRVCLAGWLESKHRCRTRMMNTYHKGVAGHRSSVSISGHSVCVC